ncbi:MAG TPA: hypothetical protein VKN36_00920 [Eudoraea sp.]|nr:hypothetical protein [Eudoraea sp.]
MTGIKKGGRILGTTAVIQNGWQTGQYEEVIICREVYLESGTHAAGTT